MCFRLAERQHECAIHHRTISVTGGSCSLARCGFRIVTHPLSQARERSQVRLPVYVCGLGAWVRAWVCGWMDGLSACTHTCVNDHDERGHDRGWFCASGHMRPPCRPAHCHCRVCAAIGHQVDREARGDGVGGRWWWCWDDFEEIGEFSNLFNPANMVSQIHVIEGSWRRLQSWWQLATGQHRWQKHLQGCLQVTQVLCWCRLGCR